MEWYISLTIIQIIRSHLDPLHILWDPPLEIIVLIPGSFFRDPSFYTPGSSFTDPSPDFRIFPGLRDPSPDSVILMNPGFFYWAWDPSPDSRILVLTPGSFSWLRDPCSDSVDPCPDSGIPCPDSGILLLSLESLSWLSPGSFSWLWDPSLVAVMKSH